ncbi:hypothetical protein HED60_11935 [Planctomycetales bacterium ZRK34]|nr:hypothetical protein HED60_11935 [Planctomycetales bacterium ZRK34]
MLKRCLYTACLLLVMNVAVMAVDPPAAYGPTPSPSQLAWQRMDMTMFVHFGVNTFTGREWGDGSEDPDLFQPNELDCKQWAAEAKKAGFGLVILTAKHHDGFCLWPSAMTEHDVASSTWRGGKGDVVKEFTEAVRAEGLKVGLYLSPWDRNAPSYGQGEPYNKFFRGQLAELLTNYGPVAEMWFDGANGEGPNGKKQSYDYTSYYKLIREKAPDAVIAIAGPDVRWVGNESGVARLNESSVVNDKRWYPAECDVSIMPGWFWDPDDDTKVKSVAHLMDIYYKSVGRNSVLLLNVGPDKRGKLSDNIVNRLREFRAAIDQIYKYDFARDAKLTASNTRGGDSRFGVQQMLDGDPDTYWAADDDVKQAAITLDLGAARKFNVVRIEEPIQLGERVTQWHVEAQVDGQWQTLATRRVIGHRQLIRVPMTTTQQVRFVIDDAAACPAISKIGLHLDPDAAVDSDVTVSANHPAEASDVHGNNTNYGPDKAIDDDLHTRWATGDNTRACWLAVDLESPQKIDHARIYEFDSRIEKFNIEVRNSPNDDWQVVYTGQKVGKKLQVKFKPVTARYVRLNILEASFAPTIWEFGVYPAP